MADESVDDVVDRLITAGFAPAVSSLAEVQLKVKALLERPPPAPAPVPVPAPTTLGKVAILGDSLMRGWLANPGNSSQPIFAPGDRLRTLLQTSGLSLTFVGTENGMMQPGNWSVTATGGWKVNDIRSRVDAVGALQPNVVILSIGTNDLGTSIPSIGTQMTTCLDSLEAAVGKIPIYVCAPVQLSWFHGASYAILFNAIVSWCATGGPNRRFVNLNAIGMDVAGADGNGDGTHWSQAGANKVAAAIHLAITTSASIPVPMPVPIPPPAPIPVPAPVPVPAPSPTPDPSALYNVETVIYDMLNPNDGLFFLDAAPNTGEQLFDNRRYAYLAVGRKRGIPGYPPYGDSHWPRQFLSDSVVQGQTVGGTIGRQLWYVFGRRRGAGTTATNTRVQIRNSRLYVWNEDGTWTVYRNDNTPIKNGNSTATWHANFRSPGNERHEGITQGSGEAQWRVEPASNGGGESLGSIGAGTRAIWTVHGYPLRVTKSRSEWINMRGVVQTIEARLILTNPSGTDDRAQSGLLSWQGADWYNNGGSWMNEHGHPRLRLLSNDWGLYGMTDIPADVLRRNKPPGFV